ncbi:MAG: hypothetical protein QOG68_2313 [Solirubrobacteraceae bacterium]|jgi:hypothetical protein|nr:hypothetical protein [Solirubrobacteraceae bacterium]
MTEAAHSDFDLEFLLRQALAPVEPPERLSQRLERTLATLTDAAAEELDSWEMAAMRDPRNWVRPVVAAGVGTTAGIGLVLLRARAKNKKRRAQSSDPLDFAERTLRDLADEARKLLDRD